MVYPVLLLEEEIWTTKNRDSLVPIKINAGAGHSVSIGTQPEEKWLQQQFVNALIDSIRKYINQ